MNEIERAIKEMCGQCVYEPGTHACKNAQCSRRIYIDALREKQEREKGCEFCCYQEYPDKTLYPKDGYIFYAGYSKQMAVDDFHEYETEEINFCPMCGRKLEGGEVK